MTPTRRLSILGPVVVVILAIAVHQCNAKQGCEPKKMKEIHKYVKPGFDYWKKIMSPKQPTVGPLKLARTCSTLYFRWVEEDGVDQKYCTHGCKNTAECYYYAVPRDYMEDCRSVNSTKPEITRDGGSGAANTDFLVFVDYVQSKCGGSTIAYASACQFNAETDRPEIAYINYCPSMVHFTPDEMNTINKTTIHELAHAFGFTSASYAYMRDEFGKPRTPRSDKGNTPSLGMFDNVYMPANNTLEKINKRWKTVTGKKDHFTYILKTETLLKVGRAHFGCKGFRGVEVENNEDNSFIGSHLEKALFKEEVMVAVEGEGYVSAFTLAFMQDTGWYKVDMTAAEHLPYGYRRGCGFIKLNCREYMDLQIRKNLPIEPWCGEVQMYCQDNGTYCNLREMTTPMPDDATYFKTIPGVPASETNRYGSLDRYTDHCPYYVKCDK